MDILSSVFAGLISLVFVAVGGLSFTILIIGILKRDEDDALGMFVACILSLFFPAGIVVMIMLIEKLSNV